MDNYKQKEKGSTVFIQDDAIAEVTREATEDQWDYDDTHTSHSVRGISFTLKDYEDSLDLDYEPIVGKDYYLLWATYSTGDSFHTETGCIVFIDLFKNKEDANECVKTLKQNSTGEYVYSTTLKSGNGKPWTFSIPWNGFFESLEEIHVEKFTMKRN